MLKKALFIYTIVTSNFIISSEVNPKQFPIENAPHYLFEAIFDVSKINDNELIKLLQEFLNSGGTFASRDESSGIPLFVSLIQSERTVVLNYFQELISNDVTYVNTNSTNIDDIIEEQHLNGFDTKCDEEKPEILKFDTNKSETDLHKQEPFSLHTPPTEITESSEGSEYLNQEQETDRNDQIKAIKELSAFAMMGMCVML